ncbi:CYTH domain-containing protein [Mycoplana dimorpha]|uniref:CYTH domain-containing protein n=1 Tax=Mycoplana dimorpha TaxID=28320 RepID=A0A2T5B5K9_MYCDI|nr:CYTH domain-containing protein [Mycoplana dimorpha]PTM94271.1 CYTH domain-containing protein [Mycoplana dimorpha]
MAKEIERKFLVLGTSWRRLANAGVSIRQGYLIASDERSLRVRAYGDGRACLTLKIGHTAMARDEYEFDIDPAIAEEMLSQSIGTVITKVRYEVVQQEFTWEIDVYGGRHSGLVVAEVELESEADLPAIPAWIGREVTGDERYSNQALALSEGACQFADEPHDQTG